MAFRCHVRHTCTLHAIVWETCPLRSMHRRLLVKSKVRSKLDKAPHPNNKAQWLPPPSSERQAAPTASATPSCSTYAARAPPPPWPPRAATAMAATDAAEARGAGPRGTSDADAQGEDNRHATFGGGRWATRRHAPLHRFIRGAAEAVPNTRNQSTNLTE
jgi:hypothetical protein